MPKPFAICLEDLGARLAGERYLRCTAVPGRQPGLRVDGEGRVLWRSDERVACELWVSLDEKLILYRPEGAAPVTVRRLGRALEAPCGKPVVLLDQDEFDTGGRCYRVHVHGEAPAVTEPSYLPSPEKARPNRAAAAAFALGAVLSAGACVEVRNQPPSPPAEYPQPVVEDAGGPPPEEPGTADAGQPEIEIRVAPPAVAPPMPLPPPPPPPQPIEVRENPPGAPVPHSDEELE